MSGLELAQQRMSDHGVSGTAIRVFTSLYEQMRAGSDGYILESDVLPLADLDDVDHLEFSFEEQRAAAATTALIKLNGGLGTTMGMSRAKSLLEVRPGQNFLDIIAGQVKSVRAEFDVELPVVFMNSFRTADDTERYFAHDEDLSRQGVPLGFVQSQEPRLWADSLTPAHWPQDPELEWCPPGHGDLYTSIATSGVLDQLIDRGITRAFVSNADNLGATPNPNMMAWFAASGTPFAAEVCVRTAADVKGGHHVKRKSDGRIVLREVAQIRAEDAEEAQDRSRHKFFNTNNLWLDLVALKARLEEHDGVLGLPLIKSRKRIDPTNPRSPEVIQLETAMGAAIEVFDGATAIVVGRDRFLPVKSTNDLVLLRSDVYEIDENFVVSALVDPVPLVNLDREFFGVMKDFDDRMPEVPSLFEAASLTVHGDWHFGSGVVIKGHASVADPGEAAMIPDGTVLGSMSWSG